VRVNEIIPVKKELSFIVKLVLAMVVSALVTLGLLYLFLSKDVGNTYGTAFRSMTETYGRLNVYVIAAIGVQLVLSSVVIFFAGLYYSHKIAGPMFRLKAVLQKYLEGAEVEQVAFRKTDFIPGVSKLFTEFFLYLGQRKKLLAEARALADQLPEQKGTEREKTLDQLKSLVEALEG